MKQIYKVLISILVISMLAATAISAVRGPAQTKNVVVIPLNQPNNTVKQSTISYTNPNSKISIFATKFSNNIYKTGGQQWASYTFYLPVASYVNVDMSGTVVADLSANAYTNWILNADGNQWGSYVDNYPTYSWLAIIKSLGI